MKKFDKQRSILLHFKRVKNKTTIFFIVASLFIIVSMKLFANIEHAFRVLKNIAIHSVAKHKAKKKRDQKNLFQFVKFFPDHKIINKSWSEFSMQYNWATKDSTTTAKTINLGENWMTIVWKLNEATMDFSVANSAENRQHREKFNWHRSKVYVTENFRASTADQRSHTI